MLGSSLFGAQLAAELGLPYAFASHFAPRALHDAIGIYRETFKPSDQLAEPYVIAGVGAIVAETAEEAADQLDAARRLRARALFSRGGHKLTGADIDAILSSPQASVVDEMLTYNAVGTPEQPATTSRIPSTQTDADELIVVHQSNSVENRLRSVELLTEAVDPTGEARTGFRLRRGRTTLPGDQLAVAEEAAVGVVFGKRRSAPEFDPGAGLESSGMGGERRPLPHRPFVVPDGPVDEVFRGVEAENLRRDSQGSLLHLRGQGRGSDSTAERARADPPARRSRGARRRRTGHRRPPPRRR